MSQPSTNPTFITCGQIAVTIADSSQVGEARRTASALAWNAGFGETRVGEVAIVVTEIASNLLRHGRGGDLILRVVASDQEADAASRSADVGLEILALDRGPGIPDVGRAMRDGFSSGGTPGTGLGAVGRMSASWDLFSTPTSGTAIVARLWRDEPSRLEPVGSASNSVDRAGGQVSLGVVSVPYPGEEQCGDAWATCDDPAGGRSVFIVADGLGHGPSASTAAGAAIRAFREHAPGGAEPAAIMTAVHAAMRSTRGGAVAIAEIARGRRELRFCGVGNVAALMVRGDGKTQSLVSQNGTAGVEARRIQQFTYPWAGGASQLIMHSDGLTTRWQLTDYAGLLFKHPSLIAGVLYRDHRRGRDDATVLVARDRLADTPAAEVAGPEQAVNPA